MNRTTGYKMSLDGCQLPNQGVMKAEKVVRKGKATGWALYVM